ncbi:MAG: sugar kinase [Colwellia polaris]|jgi:2-dehydro-3-deoxygluconokinase|uniref:sugar kinase n=1 Tax=Colwellia polaris TaxID=326537 RepID=UPI000A16E86D|nr:sugar kinase [Colwellia polaris]|tara:strand:+ start:7846 stop:8781 length:936 start_codon:yes stop_codon:yes gene_type:complete
MKNIFLFGECMIELMAASKDQPANTMKQSFAGDVFNTAVYLKRTFSEQKVHLVTAVGQDKFSVDMIEYFKSENIGTDFVYQSETKIPGLYSIQLDDQGERSFTYWRENSAARQVMQHITDEAISRLSIGDMFFFSGISLAVIEPSARAGFWNLIDRLKAAGVKIVFDPNYRPRLWSSPKEAQDQFELALEKSDLSLPGVDDFEQLFGMKTAEEVNNYCQQFALNELIIKNGEQGILVVLNGDITHFEITPVENVVDTTSAGDSFNGVYLGARLEGHSVVDSIALASKAAGFVIQHKGAIVDKTAYQQFMAS